MGDETRPVGHWRYAVLFLPYGLASGFVTVTLAFVLAQAKVPTVAIGGLIALQLAPQTWKFLYTPVIDCVWDYRRWYVGSAVLTGLFIAATGLLPMNLSALPVLSLLTLLASIASSGCGTTTSGLIAHGVPDGQKGRASGWSQAGNIGGLGVGGGLGLWVAQHAGGMPAAGAVVGLLCVLSALPLIGLVEPAHDHRAPTLQKTVGNVLRDLMTLVRSRLGILAIGLILLPIGCGGASNLFAAIAGDWRANADTVALVTGVGGGLASAAGSLLIGYVADRFDRKAAYIASGLSAAACAVAMAMMPRSAESFVVLTLLYAVTNGFMYATFFAVTLEAIGKGPAATKSQLMSCAANLPIMLVTFVEGAVQTRSGSIAMLWTDAGLTLGGIILFGVFATGVNWLWRRSVALAAAAA